MVIRKEERLPKGYTRRVGYTTRGKVDEGLLEEGIGCQRVILGVEVGYTKGMRLLKGFS